MDVKTRQQLTLAKDEWDLAIELVEREQKELRAEIHKTDSRDYRRRISQRLGDESGDSRDQYVGLIGMRCGDTEN